MSVWYGNCQAQHASARALDLAWSMRSVRSVSWILVGGTCWKYLEMLVWALWLTVTFVADLCEAAAHLAPHSVMTSASGATRSGCAFSGLTMNLPRWTVTLTTWCILLRWIWHLQSLSSTALVVPTVSICILLWSIVPMSRLTFSCVRDGAGWNLEAPWEYYAHAAFKLGHRSS